jgi:hypothetical protein
MEPSDNGLRALATRRVREKRDLLGHVVVYAIVNSALTAIWALTGAGYPWFIWPVIGWGIGLAVHAATVLFGLAGTSAAGIDREARAIEREMPGCASGPSSASRARGVSSENEAATAPRGCDIAGRSLFRMPGIGATLAQRIHRKLDIESLEDLTLHAAEPGSLPPPADRAA